MSYQPLIQAVVTANPTKGGGCTLGELTPNFFLEALREITSEEYPLVGIVAGSTVCLHMLTSEAFYSMVDPSSSLADLSSGMFATVLGIPVYSDAYLAYLSGICLDKRCIYLFTTNSQQQVGAVTKLHLSLTPA